jgi:flagellar biosynthesis protein FlhG
VGKTSVVQNLAAALAQNGRSVLVVDENPDPARGQGGIRRPRWDLSDVVAARVKLADAVDRQSPQLAHLAASRGMRPLRELSVARRAALMQEFARLPLCIDTVLIDTAVAQMETQDSLSLAAEDWLVVVNGSRAAITDGYALIKAINRAAAQRHFRIVVNCVNDEQEASGIFDNLSRVSRRYLAVTLEYFGAVPNDALLRRARAQGAAVVLAAPQAVSARRYRELARALPPGEGAGAGSMGAWFDRLLHATRSALAA